MTTKQTETKPLFTAADVGCYVDGAFGEDHRRQVLADLITGSTRSEDKPETKAEAMKTETYSIQYVTRKGAHIFDHVDSLTKVRDKIERLFKARIQAEAFADSDNRCVAAVWVNPDYGLTWMCENEAEKT